MAITSAHDTVSLSGYNIYHKKSTNKWNYHLPLGKMAITSATLLNMISIPIRAITSALNKMATRSANKILGNNISLKPTGNKGWVYNSILGQ